MKVKELIKQLEMCDLNQEVDLKDDWNEKNIYSIQEIKKEGKIIFSPMN